MPITRANWPIPLTPVELLGRIVQLQLLAAVHKPELLKICQDEQIWRYLTSYGGTADAMDAYLETALREYSSGTAVPFVIRTASCGRIVGMTRLKNISREHKSAVVGSWLAKCAWGTGANTESKLLVLTYAFEVMRCIRVEFHTDFRNIRSRSALAKIGAHEEGTLRSCHVTRDGSRRDTVVFSILDVEWAEAKNKMIQRLEMQTQAKTSPIRQCL